MMQRQERKFLLLALEAGNFSGRSERLARFRRNIANRHMVSTSARQKLLPIRSQRESVRGVNCSAPGHLGYAGGNEPHASISHPYLDAGLRKALDTRGI